MSKVVVVGLSGPSCSGKTTIALSLIKLFPRTVVVHQDDYYKPDEQIPIHAEVGIQDWDAPESYDMDKMTCDIRDIKDVLEAQAQNGNGDVVIGGMRDHFASQWANPPKDIDQLMSPDTLDAMRGTVWQKLGIESADQIPFSIILVDGILIFYDQLSLAFSSFNERMDPPHPGILCDAGVFIYAQYATLKRRREARTGYDTKDGIWTDPPGYFDSVVWPGFIKNHRKFIDFYPEILSESSVGQCRADNVKDPWNGSVAVCSSDVPVKDTLSKCVDTILSEWQSR